MSEQEDKIAELNKALLKANQDIERMSKIKSDFVGIVSHELRTPLTAIRESISLILDGFAGVVSEEQMRFLGMAKSNIDRLVGTITDILDFSKLEAGRVIMHKRKKDINELIRDVYTASKNEAIEKNLGLSLDLSDKIEVTWFDPDRVGQALRNLISNAIKFNKENGSIKISSRMGLVDGRDMVEVSVEDTGVGIVRERMSDLFKGFTQLDMSMTRRHSGLGLGLSIVKTIIELHGGSVSVDSKEGAGAKFSFTLPVYKKIQDEFNFLLGESIERARYSEDEVVLIIFEPRDEKDFDENAISKLEKHIQSIVRGPEDKVLRFKDGRLITLIACTDRSGAMKIVARIKDSLETELNFGIAVYPVEANDREELIEKAVGDLKSGKNAI